MASSDILSYSSPKHSPPFRPSSLMSSPSSALVSRMERLSSRIAAEPAQSAKVATLLARIDGLASTGKLNNPLLSLKNARKFLDQAQCDPSVSEKLQKDRQKKLEDE